MLTNKSLNLKVNMAAPSYPQADAVGSEGRTEKGRRSCGQLLCFSDFCASLSLLPPSDFTGLPLSLWGVGNE